MPYMISIRNLSKVYQLGSGSRGYRTLRESIARRLGRFGIRPAQGGNGPRDMLWALRDVSFDVRRGEVIGLVGGNGAGKSTLLKVLSRITPATAGQVDVRGRVGSLLEVGTGFHPELTGRENVYLNGAILGMRRREISRKFDEIVAFAELDRFLDTPVKRYSSGMYMRLAFAVAAHLEPDILMVDEVLAVGDASFQKRCLGKMQEVSRAGRTVLFVSHNVASIKSLCTRGILMRQGQVALDGEVNDVVNAYLAGDSTMKRSGVIPENAVRVGTGEALLRSVKLTDLRGTEVSSLLFRQPFRVSLTCDVLEEIREGLFEVSVSDIEGNHVLFATSADASPPLRLARGRHVVEVEIENCLLPREYCIDAGIHHLDGTTADFVRRTYDFSVGHVAEGAENHFRWHAVRGWVRPQTTWNTDAGDKLLSPLGYGVSNATEDRCHAAV